MISRVITKHEFLFLCFQNVEPANPEFERPRSIILIRLRQRPSADMPPIPNLFNSDASQFFNSIIQRFQEKANEFEQSVRKSFEEQAKDLPQSAPEVGPIEQFAHSIPVIRLPINIRPDSSSESSEQADERRPLLDEFKHILHHPREHHQFMRERMQPVNNRVHQFFTDVRSEWNDLVRKQPKIPVWIFLAILLSSSAILWCKFSDFLLIFSLIDLLVLFRYGYVTLSSIANT